MSLVVKVKPEVPAEILVTRPGGSLRYVPTAFKRGEMAKAGLVYPAPDPVATFKDKVAFLGEDEADIIITRVLNLNAQNYFVNACTGVDDKGEDVPFGKAFDTEAWTKNATELSSRGMTKNDLIDAIAAGVDELNKLLLDPAISMDDKRPKLEAIAARLKSMNQDLASRKPEPKTEEPVAA